jgi:acetoin:2,6-dichlorophenolindophenol oxidoreductase subunit alpha
MDRATALEMYRRMVRSRRFEEFVAELAGAGMIPGGVHLSIGQEGAAVGACMALRQDDYITGTHRSHGHPIAKGADIGPLMAELFGKRTGVNKGKGGSMHLADFSVGSLGETSIVGSGLPIATGGALSAKMRGIDRVALCFFGDGAANQGAFHESLNIASVWKLPVIYFCENNQYALSTPAASVMSVVNIADRAAAYSMPGKIVDGQDPIAVYEVVAEAVARARAGDGPTLVEAKTYRYMEHAVGLRLAYRTSDEIAEWKERDPLVRMVARLTELGVSGTEVKTLEQQVEDEVEAAVAFAKESPFPEHDEMFDDIYATPIPGARI